MCSPLLLVGLGKHSEMQGHSKWMGGPIDMERKLCGSIGYDLEYINVKVLDSHIPGMGWPIDMERNGCELIGSRAHFVTLNFFMDGWTDPYETKWIWIVTLPMTLPMNLTFDSQGYILKLTISYESLQILLKCMANILFMCYDRHSHGDVRNIQVFLSWAFEFLLYFRQFVGWCLYTNFPTKWSRDWWVWQRHLDAIFQ